VLATYDFNSNGSAINSQPLVVTGGNAANLNAGAFNVSVNPSSAYSSNVLQWANGSFSITLTQQSLYNLDKIDLWVARGASSSTRSIIVTSSLTGATQLLNANVAAVRPDLTLKTVDLSSYAEFDNIAGNVTFTFNAVTGQDGRTLEIDDIVFSGNAVPETSTFMLSLVAICAFALNRRRAS